MILVVLILFRICLILHPLVYLVLYTRLSLQDHVNFPDGLKQAFGLLTGTSLYTYIALIIQLFIVIFHILFYRMFAF